MVHSVQGWRDFYLKLVSLGEVLVFTWSHRRSSSPRMVRMRDFGVICEAHGESWNLPRGCLARAIGVCNREAYATCELEDMVGLRVMEVLNLDRGTSLAALVTTKVAWEKAGKPGLSCLGKRSGPASGAPDSEVVVVSDDDVTIVPPPAPAVRREAPPPGRRDSAYALWGLSSLNRMWFARGVPDMGPVGTQWRNFCWVNTSVQLLIWVLGPVVDRYGALLPTPHNRFRRILYDIRAALCTPAHPVASAGALPSFCALDEFMRTWPADSHARLTGRSGTTSDFLSRACPCLEPDVSFVCCFGHDLSKPVGAQALVSTIRQTSALGAERILVSTFGASVSSSCGVLFQATQDGAAVQKLEVAGTVYTLCGFICWVGNHYIMYAKHIAGDQWQYSNGVVNSVVSASECLVPRVAKGVVCVAYVRTGVVT